MKFSAKIEIKNLLEVVSQDTMLFLPLLYILLVKSKIVDFEGRALSQKVGIKKKETMRRKLRSSSGCPDEEIQRVAKQGETASQRKSSTNTKRFWSVFKLKSKLSSLSEIISLRSESVVVYSIRVQLI